MPANERHQWAALFITTLGMLMATIDASIVLIALPAVFRGIHLDPLLPSNTFFLLWMILGFLIVTSVLVVSLGRLGDLYGRVRIYNLGFAVFTFFSLLLSITWMTGTAGASGRPGPGTCGELTGGQSRLTARGQEADIPTTGWARGIEPAEPRNGASP